MDLDLPPRNKLINVLTVEVSPPYNDVAVAAFLGHSLPSDMEGKFSAYLSDRHRPQEWMDAGMALWSGEGNDKLSLANLLALKHQHIHEDHDIEEAPPYRDDDGEGVSDIEEAEFPTRTCKNPFLDIEVDQGNDKEDELDKVTVTIAIDNVLLVEPTQNM
ncbi:hypothetical protein C8R48DRAFT_775905 [Suillus tomentosus]|nr:hypothetical protein C8R48DRAFT_775905 [Suillus tomentosus]